MTNKRGLFLTNNVSKIYERVVKERNNERFLDGLSEWATGGIKKRSPVDNVMIITSIIERNKYMKKNTYLTFTDAEKCFDKLWLEDGINELWRCGTNIRDCEIIRRMNEVARITVKTPLGSTQEFTVNEIVRQGTVYGPQICIASMDKVNTLGNDVVTYYGPEIPIRAVTFVDDVSGAGGISTADNTIYNCGILEEKKMMTFNNKGGKTEYLVVVVNEEEVQTLTSEVKRGRVERVAEHKMLGTWIDETGTYRINIVKRKEKLQFMISTAKFVGSPKNVGVMAVEVRLKLGEVVIIPSILYNVEAFPTHTADEIQELEKIQYTILRQLLEVPKATPYYGLLLETGWWTMEARMEYRKLMLYHNLMNSDDKRTMKRILIYQKREGREGTWYFGVKIIIEKYNIKLPVESTLKSKWKAEVKKNISERQSEMLKEYCKEHTKTRTIRYDNHELKSYLKDTSIATARKILKYRLHMNQFPMNFKGRWSGMVCVLCNEGEASTEHYRVCRRTKCLRDIWGVTDGEDLDGKLMSNAAHYFEAVEILLEPKLIKSKQ